jgi:hypothetical protein
MTTPRLVPSDTSASSYSVNPALVVTEPLTLRRNYIRLYCGVVFCNANSAFANLKELLRRLNILASVEF